MPSTVSPAITPKSPLRILRTYVDLQILCLHCLTKVTQYGWHRKPMRYLRTFSSSVVIGAFRYLDKPVTNSFHGIQSRWKAVNSVPHQCLQSTQRSYPRISSPLTSVVSFPITRSNSSPTSTITSTFSSEAAGGASVSARGDGSYKEELWNRVCSWRGSNR